MMTHWEQRGKVKIICAVVVWTQQNKQGHSLHLSVCKYMQVCRLQGWQSRGCLFFGLFSLKSSVGSFVALVSDARPSKHLGLTFCTVLLNSVLVLALTILKIIFKGHMLCSFPCSEFYYVTTRIGFQALALRSTQLFYFSFTVQFCSTVFPLSMRCSVLAPVSLRPLLLNTQSPLIGQLTHAWTSTANNNRAAVPNRFLHAKQEAMLYIMQMCDIMTWCDVTRSRNKRRDYRKRRFRSSVFCRRNELLLVQTLTFQSFHMHRNLCDTLKERREKTNDRSTFNHWWHVRSPSCNNGRIKCHFKTVRMRGGLSRIKRYHQRQTIYHCHAVTNV